MYINGEWIQTDQLEAVKNPATNEVITEVYLVNKAHTTEAINHAKEAFSSWSKTTALYRSNYLHMIANKMIERKEDFAKVITEEMGKSIHHARYEVQSAIDYFTWYAEEARRMYGETIPSSDPSKRLKTIKQPVGVVAAITPWNFPLSMIARKFAPALAAGCTVVLKPALEAPLSAIELFKVIDEIELPKGVANLVIGNSKEIGGVLMESNDVKKITFTGSTEVGKILIRQSADTIKKVSMELGGHAPFIIFEDADLDLAVEGLIKNKFASTGQQCVCSNRVYVHDSIYDQFSEVLREKVNQLKVGNGLDESNDVGALVSESGLEKVQEHVTDAVSKGAVVISGGKRLEEGEWQNGIFYAPTVLGEVEDEMIITREETFGPVIPLIRFTSEEEVVQKANDTIYGLVAYFYTNDLSRMYRLSEQLEYGMVGVNDASPFTVQAPFGGVKQSGLGKEGGYQGLEEYVETKFISVKFNHE